MRAIGAQSVKRFIGDKPVIARFIGDEIVFPNYVAEGMIHRFDGKDNIGTGQHDTTANIWKDLISGADMSLANTVWENFGARFNGTSSRGTYSGQNLQDYTIINTHKVRALTGQHPRFCAENPYPTIYLHSGNGYRYAFYGQGVDAVFVPSVTPEVNAVYTIAVRFSRATGLIELFVNGEYVGRQALSRPAPGMVSAMYIGARAANDRTLTGNIFEHIVYNRALDADEIAQNFVVSEHRYNIQN